MTDRDPQTVAQGLAKAQREAVLYGKCGLPRLNDEWSSDCICAAMPNDALIEMGIAKRRHRYPNGIVLTALGLAVRALLEKERVG